MVVLRRLRYPGRLAATASRSGRQAWWVRKVIHHPNRCANANCRLWTAFELGLPGGPPWTRTTYLRGRAASALCWKFGAPQRCARCYQERLTGSGSDRWLDQSSHSRLATRPNSAPLAVTRRAPQRRACPAIRRSYGQRVNASVVPPTRGPAPVTNGLSVASSRKPSIMVRLATVKFRRA